MHAKSTFVLLLCTLFSGTVFSQTTVQENGYTVTYNHKNIALTFDRSVDFRAFNAKSLAEKQVAIDSTNRYTYTITDAEPAEFIRYEYTLRDGANKTYNSSMLAAQSLSTGVMNVYFNHPVITSAAQYQPALDLGSTLDDMLITYINACQSTLDIAIYNSYSPSSTTGIAGAINNAYGRGVRVRVVYDGSTGSVMIPLLNPAIPTLASPTSSSYGIMHNKFVVFDADSSNPNVPWVWTGSTNWTAVQIDGPDKNNAIAIQDQALAQAYKMEFEEMWGSSVLLPNTTVSKFGPYKLNNTPHTFVINGKAVGSYFSPSDGANAQIINVINSANTDIEIATMLITRDDVRDAIVNRYNSGVNTVQAVFDTQNPSGNDIPSLQAAIGPTKMVQYAGAGVMHHKFILVDNFNAASDPTLLTGSHNWSASAETKNDENILVIHDKNVADQYYQAFLYLYGQAGGTLATAELASDKKDLILYPNPTNGTVYLKTDNSLLGSKGSITVYNVVGSRIMERNFANMQNASVDLSNAPKGLYFVTVQMGEFSYQAKIIRK
ncbi:phospholipase D-like domain-containing protein [Chryseobacterium sp.]|uniref:phospholipase D-like domain-containing protein n=1 Tax=Chryseobacterium sp. TaxID=1871047 RepID=UPI0011C9F1F5|nr:phospholipase D-like domain-containing protein [Chryseobacterium sp.]TXF77777.1 T9SS type A sorting domain-containing protein [Chryseobacterium sp.]